MIAVDTNVLVYAHRTDLPNHARAFEIVEEVLTGPAPVGICWAVIQEFLAVVTNARIFRVPTPLERACEQAGSWLSSPRAVPLHESPTHLVTLRKLAIEGQTSGAAMYDARIAAICIDSGVRELITADRDFSRFPSVRIRNPFNET